MQNSGETYKISIIFYYTSISIDSDLALVSLFFHYELFALVFHFVSVDRKDSNKWYEFTPATLLLAL